MYIKIGIITIIITTHIRNENTKPIGTTYLRVGNLISEKNK